MRRDRTLVAPLMALALLVSQVPAQVRAHGSPAPQPVDTTGLDPLGDAWRDTNPYRGNLVAIRIGKSAYNQQCARCHGIGAVAGGLAPDLRFLPKDAEGDKVFLPLIRHGAYRDGRALMPKYEGDMSQEAMWAIRSWLDTVYEQ